MPTASFQPARCSLGRRNLPNRVAFAEVWPEPWGPSCQRKRSVPGALSAGTEQLPGKSLGRVELLEWVRSLDQVNIVEHGTLGRSISTNRAIGCYIGAPGRSDSNGAFRASRVEGNKKLLPVLGSDEHGLGLWGPWGRNWG